jgi:carbonic anhydrase
MVPKVLNLPKSGEHLAPATAQSAQRVLLEGNLKFASKNGFTLGKDAHSEADNATSGPADPQAPVQSPFAAVLGCADARVPPELVFSKGSNELFVVRVAGNVLGQECLGSLHYAVSHFSRTLKLVVVLAHANCGAVTEAVDVYLEPGKYMDIATYYSVRSIEDQILIAVRVAALSLESVYGEKATKHPAVRAALVEVAVVLNAAWSAFCLRQQFRNTFPDLGVVFGAYDLISGKVRLPLSPPGRLSARETGLFLPPKHAAGFRTLALKICRGEYVRGLMAHMRLRAS